MTGKGGPPSAHNIYEIQTSRPRAQGGPEVVGPGPSSHSQSRICTPSPRQGGAAGWSSARSSRCGKDPGPKMGPKGSISVRAVVLKRICIPPRGRGGAGWFQHPQLALRDESVLHPPPSIGPPRIPPPYDSRPPQAQSGQCGSPQAGPGYRWQATDSESVDSPGQLPQHASRLPKLFNLDCIVGMGEYLARGTMGTSPMAQGIGG